MKIEKADKLKTVKEYYFSRKLKEIALMRENGTEVINLGIGSPDLPPDSTVINKLVDAANDPANHAYQSYTGLPQLRNAFAEWYHRYFGVNLSTEEILPLMGSKEGVMHISMAFLNPGDKVLIPNPSYPTYSSVSNLVGAKPLFFDLKEENGWYPNFKELEKEDLENVKIMWVNYPNMPTGTKATKQLFQDLVNFGIKHNILIVNDNPYSFILNDKPLSILSVENAQDVALELNSLSKSHNMAGWRVGMVAGNSEYISSVLQVKSNMDSGMFKAVQLAAVKALSLNDKWFAALNKIYTERRKNIFEILDILDFKYVKDQGGLFVWAKIPEIYKNAEHFTDELLKREAVFITPGAVFGSNGEKYVRISLCNNNETLQKAKNKIKNFVKKQII